MKFKRYLSAGIGPNRHVSELVAWKKVDCVIQNADGSTRFAMSDVEVPEGWSQHAANVLAQKYLRKAGVPLGALDGVWTAGAPPWLWPRRADEGVPTGSETSARQVFHRLAGCWTYHAWVNGYFDGRLPEGYVPTSEDRRKAEENAQIFYDEAYLALAWQYGAPNSPQWFNTGLHWAYGIEGAAAGQWRVDYRYAGDLRVTEPEGYEKLVVPTVNSYEHPQPHACFIQPVADDLVNPGGIMDLVVREARLFKFGSGTGTNFSNLRGDGERLSGGGRASGLMSWLEIYDRAAGAIQSGGTTRRAAKMVICDLDHPEVEAFVDWKAREEYKVAALYAGSQVLTNRVARPESVDPTVAVPEAMLDRFANGFEPHVIDVDFEGEAYSTVSGQNSNNSVRVPNEFVDRLGDADAEWHLTERVTGYVRKTVLARGLWDRICRAAWASGDPGVQFSSTINEWHTCAADGPIRASNPCSEYLFLDDTACNLASLNLARFLLETGQIDVDLYRHLVRLFTVILDVSVQMASFPSREIALGTYKYRTLGLGPANVGGLLMRSSLPYDSDEGRALAAAMQALMTGTAYETSAELAAELGPFPRWEANAEGMKRVMRNHREALLGTAGDYAGLTVKPYDAVPRGIGLEVVHRVADEAAAVWNVVCAAESFRNAQVTVCAPTGTISFVLDCDTTGVEPEFSLVKHKQLAGGGTMAIVNPAIAPALRRMGYSDRDVELALEHVDRTGTMEGWLRMSQDSETLSVFDCSNPVTEGGRCLRPAAHYLMVAALQPFVSGGISKTVNLPRSATVEDVGEAYLACHRLGVKAVALYRDGSKLTQPLSTARPDQERITAAIVPAERRDELLATLRESTSSGVAILEKELARGAPERLPWRRDRGYTQKVIIGDLEMYWRVSEYPDGRPGEIFIELAHEGSTLRATANCLAMAVSGGLQRGVPVQKFVDLYLGTKFEPAGYVEGHPHVRFASSFMDLIARDLAITYLGRSDLAASGQPALRAVGAAPAPRRTGDSCPECGELLVQTGSCRTCVNCPYNEGCG